MVCSGDSLIFFMGIALVTIMSYKFYMNPQGEYSILDIDGKTKSGCKKCYSLLTCHHFLIYNRAIPNIGRLYG